MIPNTSLPPEFAELIEKQYAASKSQTFNQIYNGALTAIKGDPQLSKRFDGILWEDTTQIQGYLAMAYGQSGQILPDGMLKANVGPLEYPNFSYVQLGLTTGETSAVVIFGNAIEKETGRMFNTVGLPA